MTSDFAIPESLNSLGQPLQICPPKSGAGPTGYFTVAVVLVILASLCVLGIAHPPANNPPPPAVFYSLMGILAAAGVICAVVGFFAQSYTFILFPDALARTGSGEPEVFRWSDVKEVYAWINPIVGKHRLVAQDGRKVEINSSVKDGRQLGLTVQQTLFDRMLPMAEKSFQAGETLSFGPLRLDRNSLYYKTKRLTWDEIEQVSLRYNAHTRSVQFEVKTAGSVLLPWCIVRTQDIPNLDVFKKLVESKTKFSG
jgi:hypothetical protein